MKNISLLLMATFALTGALGAPHTASAAIAIDSPAILAVPQASLTSSSAAGAPAAAAAPKATAPKAVSPNAVPKVDAPKAPAAKPAASADADADADTDTDADAEPPAAGKDKSGHEDARVAIGHDQSVAADEHVSALVSVLGSSTNAGTVDEAVVSVLGDTRVTGPVGEAAVAVLGSTYVDSRVGEEVVAVMGNVELGPHAEVMGDVVAVGGELKRDPGAIVHGNVQNVQLFGHMGALQWLHSWVHHCLLYGRPLAFAPDLGWAWGIALSFLALYLLIALVFPKGIERCVATMEAEPGRSVLASLLTFLVKPIVFILLFVTVIGAILVPFLAVGLAVAGLFGKAVALAWLGRRVLPARADRPAVSPVLAVLVGGVIALLLYVVPVLGFIAYKGLDVLGLGIVVYTLLLGFQQSRNGGAPSAAATAASAATGSAGAGAAADPGTPGAEADAGAAAGSGTPGAAAAPPPAAAPSPAAAPAAEALLGRERAGFWLRMAALLLDLILVGVALASVRLGDHHILGALALYGAVMWKLKGTTVGGVICGLRIVRLDGRAIDWPTAIVRALGCFLSLVVAGLGFLWIVFDGERQSWHDKIAGTVVVRVPRGTPLV